MAVVPLKTETDVRLAPVTDAKLRPVETGQIGAAIGGGMEQLGGQLAAVAKENDRLQATYDEAGYRTLDNQFVTGAQPIRSTVFNASGLNATGAKAEAEKQIAALRSATLSQAKTPRMRGMLQQSIDARIAALNGELTTHADGQLRVAQDQSLVAGIGLAGDEARGASSPDLRAAHVATGLARIEERAKNLGWGSDQLTSEKFKFTSTVAKGVAVDLIEGDQIDQATAFIADHAKDLSSGDASDLQKMLRDPLQRRETNGYVDRIMGSATGGDTSATFSYKDPLHGLGRPPVNGGQFNAARDYGGHKGADIPAPLGSAVFATGPGTVKVTHSALGGNIVTIDHGGGNVSRYMHLGKVNVRDGDSVSPDTVVGTVGMTGRSSGPHLHFEILQDGKAVDPEKTIGQVKQSPTRHDLNSLLGAIDRDTSLSPEQRDRYKQEVERRVGRDDALSARRDADAQRAALDVIANLTAKGGENGFTSMSQLPPSIRANLAPDDRLRLENMAIANVKAATTGDKVKADGDIALTLNLMAFNDPDKFKSADLRMYRGQVTAGEFASLTMLQAKARANPNAPEMVDHSKIFSVIDHYAPDLGLNLSASKGKPSAPADRAAAQRIFTMMQADINAKTGGKRQPTDDEVKAAFDRATMTVKRVVPGYLYGERGTKDVKRYEVAPGETYRTSVPVAVRDRIIASLRRTNKGRMPAEEEIVRIYQNHKGEPGFWQ